VIAAVVLALALQDPEVELRARFLAGYDTNLLGVSRDADLVDDAPRESFVAGVDTVARLSLGGLSAEFASASRVFAAGPALSFADATLALAAHAFVDDVDFRVRASVSDAHLAGDGHFRTLRAFEPSIEWREFIAWAAVGSVDYYGGQERDGSWRAAGLGAHFELDAWTLRLDLRFLNAEGEDGRREWVPGLALTAPEVLGVAPSLALTFAVAEYESSRNDRRLAVTLSLAHESGLRFSVRFEDARSNRDEFTFTRWQPLVECEFLVARF
jgi:hypothetical protein